MAARHKIGVIGYGGLFLVDQLLWLGSCTFGRAIEGSKACKDPGGPKEKRLARRLAIKHLPLKKNSEEICLSVCLSVCREIKENGV